MHMVRHDHESDAAGRLTPQLVAQLPQDDPLRLVLIQQPTPPMTGERHEVRKQLIIGDPAAIGHVPIMSLDALAGNLLRLSPPRKNLSGPPAPQPIPAGAPAGSTTVDDGSHPRNGSVPGRLEWLEWLQDVIIRLVRIVFVDILDVPHLSRILVIILHSDLGNR